MQLIIPSVIITSPPLGDNSPGANRANRRIPAISTSDFLPISSASLLFGVQTTCEKRFAARTATQVSNSCNTTFNRSPSIWARSAPSSPKISPSLMASTSTGTSCINGHNSAGWRVLLQPLTHDIQDTQDENGANTRHLPRPSMRPPKRSAALSSPNSKSTAAAPTAVTSPCSLWPKSTGAKA
jgi:hypothetical protein